jgi:hypothetical protein
MSSGPISELADPEQPVRQSVSSAPHCKTVFMLTSQLQN